MIRDGVAVPVLWPYGGQNLSLPSGESLQLRALGGFPLSRKMSSRSEYFRTGADLLAALEDRFFVTFKRSLPCFAF